MYQLVNKTHVLNTDTWTLEPVSGVRRPFSCEVPFPLWKYRRDAIHKSRCGLFKFNEFRKTTSLQLNGFDIHIAGNSAQIRLADKMIDLTWAYKEWGTEGFDIRILDCVTYRQKIGDDIKSYVADILRLSSEVVGLGRNELKQFDEVVIQFGISEKRFSIVYDDITLSEKKYALVYGTWVILLSDKFEFDSLAYLWCIEDLTLHVDKFAYTVNPQIMKAMFLKG